MNLTRRPPNCLFHPPLLLSALLLKDAGGVRRGGGRQGPAGQTIVFIYTLVRANKRAADSQLLQRDPCGGRNRCFLACI